MSTVNIDGPGIVLTCDSGEQVPVHSGSESAVSMEDTAVPDPQAMAAKLRHVKSMLGQMASLVSEHE